ncbi:DA1, partial [Prunus dulcis]
MDSPPKFKWHPHCFRCHACDLPITGSKFSMHENHPYHMPATGRGIYDVILSSHEDDGTPRCCCCGRIKPRNTIYYLLNDGRHQCLECRDSAITEANECEALFLEIQKLFDLKFQEKIF